MATFFGDVFKGTKDFFAKSFNFDNKVELKATGANNVNFTAEGGIKSNGAAFATLKADRRVGGVVVEKLSVGTDAKLTGEFSFPDMIPDHKATFKVEDGTRTSAANTSAVFGLEGKANLGVNTGYKLDVDAVGGAANFSALTNYEGFLLGGRVQVDTGLGGQDGASFAVKDHGGVIGYQGDGSTYGVQLDKKCHQATAFFHVGGNKKFAVAGKAQFGLHSSSPKDVSVAFGGMRVVDGATVYGAVNQKAVVQVGYETPVGGKSTLGVYGEVQALDIASDNHRFGVNLKMKA